MINNSSPRQIYSVASLTKEIKSLLEDSFPFIWVNGEISNFSSPGSGHYYFTLKDTKAQISAVMFRGQNRNLRFRLENGISVTGLGRISLYEPRGAYQIIFEYLEPQGIGALQVAYEQLKAKLSEEGLFNKEFKKDLPFLPETVSIVTSPTGAVIHDIINVASRRNPGVKLEVFPVMVQGSGSESEISGAINALNMRKKSDLIILARGGGSLEDLASFNSEDVARAIFASEIPVISAVGHETDFTIADFVSDLRAPTPSAAAEIAVPDFNALKRSLNQHTGQLKLAIKKIVDYRRFHIDQTADRLIDPRKKIIDFRLRLDDYTNRLQRGVKFCHQQKRDRLDWKMDKLLSLSPENTINNSKMKLKQLEATILKAMSAEIALKQSKLKMLTGRLIALSPKAILDRGYSITRTIPEHRLVGTTSDVSAGKRVEILVSDGRINCHVEETIVNGKKDI